MDTAAREAKRKASRDANLVRRAQLECSSVLLKIQSKRLKPKQKEALERLFLETKWFYNHALATGNTDYKLTNVKVKTPHGFESRELVSGARIRQAALKDLETSKKALAAAKRSGRKIGGLRFKSRCDSVGLLGYGQSHRVEGNRIKVTGVPGLLPVHGVKQLEGRELGGARLIRKPSGLYLRLTTWRQPKSEAKLDPVGLDFGIKTHITVSDGREWSTVVKESERLKRLQRKLSRQQKGSNRYWATRNSIEREYEKIGNKRDEAANQLVAQLKRHSVVALQDENLRGWKRRRGKKRGFGRAVQHGVVGRAKAKLSALDNSVVVSRWEPTTQFCPSCASLNKHKLSERIYRCDCGYSAPRDQHSARNMLIFAGIYSPEELGGALVEPGTTARERALALSLVSAGAEARNEHGQEGEPVSRSEAAEKRHRLQRCP